MRVEKFFYQILKLRPPWYVKTVVLNAEKRILDVTIEFDRSSGRQFSCPTCGNPAKAVHHDVKKKWRHLDTCLNQTYLHAAFIALDCPTHGRVILDPPWGRHDSPHTFALEQYCMRLAKHLGSIKVAARLAGVSPNEIRTILQREASADRDSLETTEKAERPQRAKQLSFFAQQDMPLINEGIRALNSLQLEQAIDLFKRYQSLYPKGYDVAPKISMAEFLLKGFQDAPAEYPARLAYLCTLCDSFEDRFEALGSMGTWSEGKLKKAFFERLVEEAEQSKLSESSFISERLPLGYLFLQTGEYDRAIRSIQGCIVQAPDHAELYGYLGDAYWLRGDTRIARQCYREACLIDPVMINWEHVKDGELLELVDDLVLRYGLDRGLALQWLPSHARIAGLFEPKLVRLNAGLEEMVQEYLSLESAFSKAKDPGTAARLFLRGLILCENEDHLRWIKKIDPIAIRKNMRAANSELFEEFLEMLVNK